MNLEQMEMRCPQAEVVASVQLPGYELSFCGPGNGVATIKPRMDSMVAGVLWRITAECERNLDYYEGFPHLYGKELLCVEDRAGNQYNVMAYTMNPPYCHQQAVPSHAYLQGILDGCRQNRIAQKPVLQAYNRAKMEMAIQKKTEAKNQHRPIR